MKPIKEYINLSHLGLTWEEPYRQDIFYLLSILLTESQKIHHFSRRSFRKRSIMELAARELEAIAHHCSINRQLRRAVDAHAVRWLSDEELEEVKIAGELAKMRHPLPRALLEFLELEDSTIEVSIKRKRAEEDGSDDAVAPPHKHQRGLENENEEMEGNGGVASEDDTVVEDLEVEHQADVEKSTSVGQPVAMETSAAEDEPTNIEKSANMEKPANAKQTTKKGSKKTTNTRNSKGDAPVKTEEDQILHHIRDALTARSKEKADYDAFKDAICPDNNPSVELPLFTEKDEEEMKKPSGRGTAKPPKAAEPAQLGDPSNLHPSEVAFCSRIGLDYASYRCQKRRIFLAIAICTEFYARRLEQQPTFRARAIGVSQAQVFCNIDVNITSSMMRAFQFWQWVPTLVSKHPNRRGCFVVSQQSLDRFPQGYRVELLREVAMWEEEAKKPLVAGKSI